MASKSDKMGFSNRLSDLMKEKKLTLGDIAKAIGKSVPSVHRWTHGGEIDFDNLLLLATFLEVNWIWLRFGDEALQSMRLDSNIKNEESDVRTKYLDEIIENETRMKLALSMAQVVCWEWSVLTKTFKFSEGSEKILGINLNQISNSVFPFANEDIPSLLSKFSNKSHLSWDFKVNSSDTIEEKWFTSRATMIFDSMERPLKLIGICADITDRKKTEKSLEYSEQMMRNMIDIVPVGLCGADKDGHIRLLNPALRNIWGGEQYVDLENYGVYKGWKEGSKEELGPEGWALYQAYKLGKETEKEIVDIETFDGEIKKIVMFAKPLIGTDNEIIGAIEVNQDITEIKQYEQGFHNWQKVFNQKDIGILVTSDQNAVIEANEKILSVTGLEKSEILRMKLSDILSSETLLEVEEKKLSAQQSYEINGLLKNNSHKFRINVSNNSNTSNRIFLFFS